MTRALQRLSIALALLFIAVGLTFGYWSLIRRSWLVGRDDNPRLVLAEQRIQRGTIFDRNGGILAESTRDPGSGLYTRQFPHPEVASVVGYYSLRYGVGGIEAAFDDLLRGNYQVTVGERLARVFLHKTQVGGDIRLTLDLSAQQTAMALLDGYAGAVIVLSVPEGDVLALVSSPSFDPAALDANWEDLAGDPTAPLLNRSTQGLYQPGTILQSVLLAAGLNSACLSLEDSISPVLTSQVNGLLLPCAASSDGVETLAAAYTAACPAPFVEAVQAIGELQLLAALRDFGLLAPPEFILPSESSGQVTSVPDLALGQSDLMVTPLQMALVAAAFADHGQIPPLRLVSATRQAGGSWETHRPSGFPRGAVSRAAADAVAGLMAQAVNNGSARQAAIPGYAVAGHSGIAITGQDGTYNGWFIGFLRVSEDRSIAVAVLVENTIQTGLAASIGGQVLQAAAAVYP
nr:hypothetical protein [Anaerolineae bacterium]